MEFNIELKGFKEAIKDLNPENVLKAARKTIQRAAGAGKTIISSQIREKYALMKGDVDRKIDVDLKNIQNLEATLTVTGKPISLMYFKPTQITGGVKLFAGRSKGQRMPGLAGKKTKSRSRGVRVRILKSKPVLLKRAFMAIGKHGVPLVFRRKPMTVSSETSYVSQKTGKPVIREKLAAYKIITPASIAANKDNLNAVIKRIDEQLVKEWNQNIKHFGKL